MRQQKNRDRSTLRHSGPCLICAKNTAYGRGGGRGLCNSHVQYGDEWLDRYFAEHTMHSPISIGLRVAGTREIATVNGHSFYSLNPYLCESCRARVRNLAEAKYNEDRQREAEQRAAAQFEREWRRPQSREFEITEGERRFLFVEVGYGYHQVLIRYRVTRRWCVGSRPVCIYAMFVDGRLEARLYHDSGDKDDPVAECFAIWFQNRWQDKLIAAKPTDTWNTKNPNCSTLMSWEHVASGGGEWPSWCLVHTRWIDGTVYAAVEHLRTFKDAVDFAKAILNAELIPQTQRWGVQFRHPEIPKDSQGPSESKTRRRGGA